VDKLLEIIERHMVLTLMRSDHREEMSRIYNNSVNAAKACQQIRKIFKGEEIMTDQHSQQPQQEFVASNANQYHQHPFQPPQMQQQQYNPNQYIQQESRPNEQLLGEFDAIMNELSQLSNIIMSVQRKLYGICMKLK